MLSLLLTAIAAASPVLDTGESTFVIINNDYLTIDDEAVIINHDYRTADGDGFVIINHDYYPTDDNAVIINNDYVIINHDYRVIEYSHEGEALGEWSLDVEPVSLWSDNGAVWVELADGTAAAL